MKINYINSYLTSDVGLFELGILQIGFENGSYQVESLMLKHQILKPTAWM